MSTPRHTLACIVALLALGLWYKPAGVFAARHGVSGRALLPLLALWRAGPNAEDAATTTRGYYQGLLDGSATALTRGFLSMEIEAAEAWRDAERFLHARRRDDFLLYDVPLNLAVDTPTGPLRTNAHGLCDDPCTVEKPPGVRRVALVGSSMSRGFGVGPEADFESLLELRLNEAHRPVGVERIEILNFAIDGYRPTQMLACAQDRCPEFEPDVYLWELSMLASPGQWSGHVIALVQEGKDLRYPLLKEVAEDAGVSRYDQTTTMAAKLAPQQLRVQRFILETMRDHARESGAELVVLILPEVKEDSASDFTGLDELLSELDLRVLDLRSTFDGVGDLDALRMGPLDFHPNGAGHRLLAEGIEAALVADPELLQLLVGP